MKKIYLIITSMMLLLFLVACLPPTDKTTEYKEKNDEFKKYILEKLKENEENYNRVFKSFTVTSDEEIVYYRYEIIYCEDKIRVFNTFTKQVGELETGEWIVYTYDYNKSSCSKKVYNDNKYEELISEEKLSISLEEFLELYEHKEYANYNLDLSGTKITKIVKESMQAGWYYETESIHYEICFNPKKEFHFEVLGNEIIFNNCSINMSEPIKGSVIIKGEIDSKDCSAVIIINQVNQDYWGINLD